MLEVFADPFVAVAGACLGGLLISELFIQRIASLGLLGCVCWIFSLALLVGYSCRRAAKLFTREHLPQTWPVLILLAWWAGAALLIVCQTNMANFESIIEMKGANESFAYADYGFQRLGALGYPMRAFYLPLFLTKYFHSFVGLNVGFALPFVPALLLFAEGLYTFFGSDRRAGFLAALALALLAGSPTIAGQSFMLEQTFWPVCWAMAVIGLMLSYQSDPNVRTAAVLSVVLTQLVVLYTPSLAVYAASLPVLAFWGWRDGKSRPANWIFALGVAASLVVFVYSLVNRLDLRIFPLHVLDPQPQWRNQLHSMTYRVFAASLLDNGQYPFFGTLFRAFLFMALVVAAIGYGRAVAFVAAAGIFIALYVAGFSRGYAVLPPEVAVYRAAVLLPGCAALVAYVLFSLLRSKGKLSKQKIVSRWLAPAFLAVAVVPALMTTWRACNARSAEVRTRLLVQVLASERKSNGPPTALIFQASGERVPYFLNDLRVAATQGLPVFGSQLQVDTEVRKCGAPLLDSRPVMRGFYTADATCAASGGASEVALFDITLDGAPLSFRLQPPGAKPR